MSKIYSMRGDLRLGRRDVRGAPDDGQLVLRPFALRHVRNLRVRRGLDRLDGASLPANEETDEALGDIVLVEYLR